jgi:hypothetical protein
MGSASRCIEARVQAIKAELTAELKAEDWRR